jgi:DNA-binding NarL/FixJ family response regulator
MDTRSVATLRTVAGPALRLVPRPQDDEVPVGIRVLVVGDDLLARRGLLAALRDEPGMTVVGEQRPGPAVLAIMAAKDPDVVLLHGVCAAEVTSVVREARRGHPVRVLAIGVRQGEPLPADACVCGALPAWTSPEEVVAAVRMAAAGFALRPADAAEVESAGRDRALRDGLSERECDVLALVATGLSNAEIAARLVVSEHTVKSHVQHLLAKLDLRNRVHAVIYAFEIGLR